MCPENLGTHLFNAIGLLLVLQLRAQELTVEASDVSNADLLWTLCLASTCIGTVTEAELIHLCNHSLCTACALNAALWQLRKRRYTSSNEQHSRAILTSCSTSTTTYASRSIHRLVSISLRNRNSVSVRYRVGTHRNETSRLQNLVVSRTIYYKVLDYRERCRTPRLNGDCCTILELTHVDLAGSNRLRWAVSVAVDVQRTHTADTLTTVVIKCHKIGRAHV